MFGRVIVDTISSDHRESDQIIAAGKHVWLCHDWTCPKRGHCKRHFGLSKRYAAMAPMTKRDALVAPSRTEAGCRHYGRATRDHFAESLGRRPSFPVPVQ